MYLFSIYYGDVHNREPMLFAAPSWEHNINFWFRLLFKEPLSNDLASMMWTLCVWVEFRSWICLWWWSLSSRNSSNFGTEEPVLSLYSPSWTTVTRRIGIWLMIWHYYILTSNILHMCSVFELGSKVCFCVTDLLSKDDSCFDKQELT